MAGKETADMDDIVFRVIQIGQSQLSAVFEELLFTQLLFGSDHFVDPNVSDLLI